MTVRTPTKWYAPLGNGYVNVASNNIYLNPFGQYEPPQITTQSKINLLTQAGVQLLINPNVYAPKNHDLWTSTGKGRTSWIPKSGEGYVFTSLNYQGAMQQGFPLIPGTNQITDNKGDFFVTNTGQNIVTTPVIVVGKFATLWQATGA